MKLIHAVVFLFSSIFLFSFSSDSYFRSGSSGSGVFYLSGTGQQHSSSIGKQIASAIPIIGLAQTGFGYIKSLFSAKKEGGCTCQDQDLCKVEHMSTHEIQKICDQLNGVGNLCACSYQQTFFDIRWHELGLDRLSIVAQKKLRERVYQEQSRREQIQISQEQEQRRQQQLAKQKEKEEKVARQQPVARRFINNKNNVETYAHTIKNKNQKRARAIKKALDNNFRATYERYNLSSQATKLLRKNNINVKQFHECVGNAIQQQIHQEFVDVLNNGADLYSSQETNDLADQWYSVLSNVSCIGSSINNIGHFILAHDIADICEGLYQIEKRRVNFSCDSSAKDYLAIEELWNAALICVGNALQKGGDKVIQFAEGVQQKAIGRPARFLTEFACLLKHEPEAVFETAVTLFLNSIRYAFDSVQLVEDLVNDPFSKNTFERVSDFGNTYVEPAHKKITEAAQIFWHMPAEEKAQELIAFGAHIISIVGAVKILAAIPAYVAFTKASILMQLDKLSQFSEPIMQADVLPGGQAALTLQTVDCMSEELVAAAEEALAVSAEPGAILATPVIDAVSTMVLAVKNGTTGIAGGSTQPTPPQISDEEFSKKIAENIEAIRKMKEQGIEVSPEYERLALEGKQLLKGGRAVDAGVTHPYMTDQEAEELRNLFIEEMGGEETLKKLGLEGGVIDKRFIKHILSPEIKTMVTRAGRVSKKLSGCHFIDRNLVKKGSLRYEIIEDGLVKNIRIFCDGASNKKTVWPFNWTKKNVIKAIGESIKKAAEKVALTNENITLHDDSYSIDAILKNGIKITTKLTKDMIFKTSYPEI